MKFLHRSKSQSSLLPSEISNLALVIKETKKSFCDSKRISLNRNNFQGGSPTSVKKRIIILIHQGLIRNRL